MSNSGSRTVWLSYAWKDNDSEDVDFAVQQLASVGLKIELDRTQLLAGRRLWPQIEARISDPDTSAWCLYATENSLASEPCQEELAYALDRALRTRGFNFPLIGIFPRALGREMIPAAIATRLFVTLEDDKWAQRVADAVNGRNTIELSRDIAPFGIRMHQTQSNKFVEIWPRQGVWNEFFPVLSPLNLGAGPAILIGPPDYVPQSGMSHILPRNFHEGKLEGISGRIDQNHHVYVQLGTAQLIAFYFLQNGKLFRCNP